MELTLQEQIAAINHAARAYGVHMVSGGQPQGLIDWDIAQDHDIAMDTMPPLVTVSNSGVPAFLTNFVDPKLIEVLTAPLRATQIYQETKKGDWVTFTAFFSMVESTGEVSSYGDYNQNGEVGVNANWPQRQSYHFQTMTQWGDMEMARMGKAQIDWASQKNISSGKIMGQFANKCYFYGVQGLQNYGILNDPSLPASISPNAKAAGGFTWLNNATYLEIINDINKLYAKLVAQTAGLVTRETPMTMALSPVVEVALSYVATLGTGVSVFDTVKKTYPNLKVVSAQQYSTGSGELVQLIADELEGQVTGQVAFTEKMRAHGVVREVSAYREKKSSGTWGAIIFNPSAVASMLGV